MRPPKISQIVSERNKLTNPGRQTTKHNGLNHYLEEESIIPQKPATKTS